MGRMKEIAMMIEDGCSVVQLASWIHDNAATEMTMADAKSTAHGFIKSHGDADYEPVADGHCSKCHKPPPSGTILDTMSENYYCDCLDEVAKKRDVSTMNIPDSLSEEE